jgi:hypothetical protein
MVQKIEGGETLAERLARLEKEKKNNENNTEKTEISKDQKSDESTAIQLVDNIILSREKIMQEMNLKPITKPTRAWLELDVDSLLGFVASKKMTNKEELCTKFTLAGLEKLCREMGLSDMFENATKHNSRKKK